MMLDTTVDQLFKAVHKVDLNRLKELWGDELTPNSIRQKSTGDTLLHAAVRLRSGSQEDLSDILNFLIQEKKAKVNAVNYLGKTALHEAVQASNERAVKRLLMAGANVNALKKSDWTPLMLACTKGCPETVKLVEHLLKYRADPLFTNKDGWNCFHMAARVGHPFILGTLLRYTPRNKRGTLCHSPSKNGRLPMHTAAQHGSIKAVKLLLSMPTGRNNINKRDKCGMTPFMEACRFGQTNIINLLTYFQVDFSIRNSAGMNCLHLAAEAGRKEALEQLVTIYQFDVNSVSDGLGMSALHWAVREQHISTIEALLKLGADYNLKATNGQNCLDYAKILQKTESVKFLETYFNELNSNPEVPTG